MPAIEWTWDDAKATANFRKHGVLFETACAALDDPRSLAVEDEHPDGDRWRTLGMIGDLLLFIVHTQPDTYARGRIISARRATPRERRVYEHD